MKKLLLLLISFGFLIAPSVKAEIVLYCQSELETGFFKENGSWKVSEFHPQRLTIKFNDDYSILYGLSTDFICSQAYPHAPNSIACLDKYKSGRSFLFNKEKKRYVFSSISLNGGYELNTPTSDTENLYAGRCKTF
tara:strand:+ start:135 stop:542 length:408 start_codon:yes stop_codon:yes gene_type:complete